MAISNMFKKLMVEKTIKTILNEDPSVTKDDVRKIFNYGYRLFWKKGDKEYDKIREEMGLGQVGVDTPASAPFKISRKSTNVRKDQIRTKQLAKPKRRKKKI